MITIAVEKTASSAAAARSLLRILRLEFAVMINLLSPRSKTSDSLRKP
jgi:hypothetical protein